MTESSLQRFQENNQLRKQEARRKRKEIDQKIKETSASKVVRGLVGGGVALAQKSKKKGYAHGGRVSTYEYEAGRNPKQPLLNAVRSMASSGQVHSQST